MTRENVGLKSAPAEQAYLPQHENVVHGRVLAGEIHQPQWRLRDLGRHLNRCIRSQAAFHAQLAQLRPPNANRDLEVERWRYVEAPAFPDSVLR